MTAVEPGLQAHYAAACAKPTAIQPHLPRLRDLAAGCDLVVEFGVKKAASSSALLLGAERVISYDLVPTPEARLLHAATRDRWDYRIGDSRYAPVTDCELLFVDSLHTYEQCRDELARHADAVSQFLVFHDTITFGSIGAQGESGQHRWIYTPGTPCPAAALGIRPAIDELMIRDPSWRIRAHYTDSHGLLVLERA
ncbi:MAG TPA: hypothetical protein VFO31_20415 [Vicinamibacterales bacterium]|nr:hypothetical protein [Vicinamibacterales bacterium]